MESNCLTKDQSVSAMTSVTTNDGVDIFYKNWRPKAAQPIVFIHGSLLAFIEA
jgi:hypothetical protein